MLVVLQMKKEGNAGRNELEHALTKAVMDQDPAATDEAAVVPPQKQHKLERLFSRMNMTEAALVCA